MERNDFLNIWRQRRSENMPSPAAALDPYTGPWTKVQAIHLLRRLCFGVKKQDVDKVVAQGLNAALKDLLVVDAIPPDPVNVYSYLKADDPDVKFGASFVNAPINGALPPEYYQGRMDVLKAWWIGNMINQNTNITEKMTFFWHNHFAVEADVVQFAQAMHQYYKLLRLNCLGNFKALAKLITINPAMLYYLNGYKNNKTAPDENYARELQELFTIGKGPDSKYTEGDVKAAARVLTGLKFNPFVMPMTHLVDYTQHDDQPKQFSSFYKDKVINYNFFGEPEIDELITMLFDNIETSRHICRKLYRFFIYYEIDDTIETTIIHPLADYLKQQNFEIKKVLERLFSSQHFFDMANLGCVIKSPLDYTVGMCREFSVAFPIPIPKNDLSLVNQYLAWGAMAAISAYQGLHISEPPVVAGWQAWYQQPQYHEIWINADSLANRNKVTENINSPAGLQLLNIVLKIDPIIFASLMPNPKSALELVKDSVSYLYNYPLSDKSYEFFKTNLINGYPNDSYWTLAWEQFQANPGDPALRNAISTRLSALYTQILSQAEYHLS